MAPGVPQWIDVPTVRAEEAGLEPTLADIQSRIRDPNTYKDSRHVTWAHETTHGINSQIRNQPSSLSVPVNGFYVLNGKGIQLLEPGIKLRDIAEDVPTKLCGMAYQLYLVDQRKYWNDQPLYVLDEWSAYLNGLQTAMDVGGGDGQPSDCVQALEFMAYSLVMLQTVKKKSDYSLDNFLELRNFVAWQCERTMQLLKKAEKTKVFSSDVPAYLDKLLNTQALMDFVILYFGQSWYSAVFQGEEWFGVF